MKKSHFEEISNTLNFMTKELEVYLSVSSQIAVNHYSFKAFLQENNIENQVYSYEPIEDSPSQEGFKQLTTPFPIIMRLQIKQYLNISILERSSRRLFGRVEDLTVGELFGSRREGVRKMVMSGQQEVGEVFVSFEDREGSNELVSLEVSTEEIQFSRFLCCGGEYYFTITKPLFGRNHVIYRSEPSKAPSEGFKRIQISTRRLCNAMPNQDFALNFHNYSDNSLIGKASCSLTLLDRRGHFHVEDEKINRGRVNVKHQRKERQYEFAEFFSSGMQMALVAAIDYTASNGPLHSKNSLHYFKGTSKSCYQIALEQVCGILLEFDYDKKVPVYGFGAIVNYKEYKSGSSLIDFFPLTGTKDNHDLIKLEGILDAYRECTPHLTFAGPTRFAPILRNSIANCRDMKKEGKEYMILLIMTDSDDVSDYGEVVDLVVECSRLPISIIIIGITRDPKEKWPLMKKLDNNNLTLTNSMNRKAERDMVKFVEFMRCYQTPGELSKEVLKELPKQVEEYHRLEGITPQDYKPHLRIPDGYREEMQHEVEEVRRLNEIGMASQNKKNNVPRNPEQEEQPDIKPEMPIKNARQEKNDAVEESLISIKLEELQSRASFAIKNYTPGEDE